MRKLFTKFVFLFTLTTVILFSGIGVLGATESTDQASIDQKADAIVTTAINLIGKATYSSDVYKPTYPYQFGCSGFAYYAFSQNGIDLATRSCQRLSNLGVYVPKSQLKKGDLVFFDSILDDSIPVSHVGIYIGDNKIVHMADPKNNVIISDLDGRDYYRDFYITARRIIPSYMPSTNLTIGDKIVGSAENMLGKVKFGSPYNQKTLTFNNPGFTYYIYKNNGIDLRSKTTSSEQVILGKHVLKSQLQKGDLVFFSTESYGKQVGLVAIYAGNSQIILNASSSLGVVKRLLTNDFYRSHYLTARRIL